ncbi:M23 family metallopeptidase [Ramlibacter montanisoli]|uniref:M23 family metallopeptidase n=1 Tax=Ramlibacter montanisoli TaxID=2732512 RepID=UPI0028159991|nr:M23 family metallopeptidase [Ramlibacter montanisoli]
MHFIITDAWLAKSRAVHLSGTKLVLALVTLSLVLMLMAAGLYHWVFLKGARERWPVVGTLVRFVVQDEFEQRDRFMRENLDAMARKLGEMQAKMQQLEALGERVGGLAGVNSNEIKVAGIAGRGGVLVEGRSLTLQELQATLNDLEQLTGERTDLLTVMESRLIDQRLKKMMVPTQNPIHAGHVGSPFGWRIDPFTGRSALHTGLDFQAEPGTPILSAAGGVVVASELHAAYGNMVEVDHGNNLITRYAHASRLLVKKGDLVKRGQKLALVGSTGRSTGPHLHFEVLVQGVPQDPGASWPPTARPWPNWPTRERGRAEADSPAKGPATRGLFRGTRAAACTVKIPGLAAPAFVTLRKARRGST